MNARNQVAGSGGGCIVVMRRREQPLQLDCGTVSAFAALVVERLGKRFNFDHRAFYRHHSGVSI